MVGVLMGATSLLPHLSVHVSLLSCFFFFLPGKFRVKNVVPTEEGDASKVKVKVRLNIHGVFTVKSATMVEKQKVEEESMETDPPATEPPATEQPSQPSQQQPRENHRLPYKAHC